MTEDIPQDVGRRCSDCQSRIYLQKDDLLGCACSMWDPNNQHELMPECWD